MNPVESVVSEGDTTQAPTVDSAPTQSFFPTVAVIENSLDASTIRPETHTFVPFIPNVLPEADNDETPLMAGVEEESTEGTAEEPRDIILEAITEQEEEAVPEVEEIPAVEPEDGGEAEPDEQVTDGKTEAGC